MKDSLLSKEKGPYEDWKLDDDTNTVDSSFFSATEVMKIEFNGT